ncbi:MAG TPA: hypothetical protein VM100_05025 [Longimicrobiales bacterium]|nr:hypothetical protein [Longimicrobiales bacterium]
MRFGALTLCLLAVTTAANAQDPSISRADLPRSVEYRLNAVLEDPNTRQITGESTIDDTVRTDVVVRKGPLLLKGRIEGQLVVIEGDVTFSPGSTVTGDVTIIAGQAYGLEEADVGGTVTMYEEGFGLFHRGERIYTVNRERGRIYRDDDRRDWGRSSLTVNTAWNYNRVEGLPIEFGPAIETRGRNPTRIQAHAIWRTEQGGPFNTDRWGYDIRVEQFLGNHHDFRIGGALSSVVQPIEDWQLNRNEASLATLVLHEDYRDYFKREGWTAFARYSPRNTGIALMASYNDEKHFSEVARDPWTLFGDGDWRLQPLVTEGRFRTVNGAVQIDRRDDDDFATNGFFVRSEITHGLNREFTHGLIDARIYRPTNSDGVLSLRGVLAGVLGDKSAPGQFQHALGGAGTLPGYSLFAADCGARAITTMRDNDLFYTSYGCDRTAMGSIEYRGGFDIHEYNIDSHPNWIFFFDAGRGWSKNGVKANTGMLYDVGGGIVIGDVGIYGAVPLTGSERSLKFFVRLGPRF